MNDSNMDVDSIHKEYVSSLHSPANSERQSMYDASPTISKKDMSRPMDHPLRLSSQASAQIELRDSQFDRSSRFRANSEGNLGEVEFLYPPYNTQPTGWMAASNDSKAKSNAMKSQNSNKAQSRKATSRVSFKAPSDDEQRSQLHLNVPSDEEE